MLRVKNFFKEISKNDDRRRTVRNDNFATFYEAIRIDSSAIGVIRTTQEWIKLLRFDDRFDPETVRDGQLKPPKRRRV